MSQVNENGHECAEEMPQLENGAETELMAEDRARFARYAPLWNDASIWMGDVAEWVVDHCEDNNIPASSHRHILAATVAVLEWEAVREALSGLVEEAASQIVAQVARCFQEERFPRRSVRVEVGDFGGTISVPELLEEVNYYLSVIPDGFKKATGLEL